MNDYVNAFQCFSSNDRAEVVIQFFQNFPVSALEDDTPASVENALVSSLVMNKTIALQLIEKLTDMLQGQ